MGMLDGLVGKIAREAASSALEKQGGLGGILGGLVRGQQSSGQAPTGSLGDVLGSILGGAQKSPNQPPHASPTGSGSAGLLLALLPVVLTWIQQQGGLEKVLASLQGSGLGAQAQSWMSTAHNQSIEPQQVEQVFGVAQVDQFARQTGASREAVLSGIAGLLPQVIDQLTPKGDASHSHQANQDITAVLGQLAGLLGGSSGQA